MGVGYDYVDQALNGNLVLTMLLLFGGLKMAATIVAYASGNAGGIFAPSLYIGAMLGGAVGIAVHTHAPFATGEPGAYALVGMGTLFAGIIRAPLTSVFMIFEITQDYQILVPLMIANMLSFLISRRYQPVPVYDALLRQDRIHLPEHGLRRFSGGRTARDLMTPGAALLDAPPVVHVHPDHSLDVVFERFADADDALPVVSRLDARRVEGTITVDAIVELLRARRESHA
jgi:CIC family chloride channel protein